MQAALGLWFAWIALGLGLLDASVSMYWGLGGTRLLDTVGGGLEAQSRAGNHWLIAVVWLSVVLKLCAAGIGLAAMQQAPANPNWLIRAVGWTAGTILFVYGFVLTGAGLLVQTGVIATTAESNRKALRWHTYLWDPWFMLWGTCILGAMICSRPRTTLVDPNRSQRSM